MARQLNYANGMTPGAAKRVGQFVFGEFFREIEKNESNWCFDVVLYAERGGKKITDVYGKEFIEWFKEFWGKEKPGFEVVIFKEASLEE